MICAEDDPADTIRPRLDAAGADCRRVHMLRAAKILSDDGNERSVAFDLSNVDLIRAALDRLPECKPVVIDPIGSYLGGRTTSDGDQFKAWLLTQQAAAATVAKRLSFTRTFFHVARKHKLIDENPFCEVKIPTANVSLRQRFIDRDMVEKLLSVATPAWRTIIALARFGGLRCPSEVLSLEWRHVDWERGRLTVPSPKTDRYDGKESRTIPLFPELRTYLEEAFELAGSGQTHVIGGDHLAKATRPTGWKSCNLRPTFGKLVKRAGLAPWPRLFHQLRSSQQTELPRDLPAHFVAWWMDHDAKVSLKHYAQTTDEHFERATRAAESDAPALQNALHWRAPSPNCCRLYNPGPTGRTRSGWPSSPWCDRVRASGYWPQAC